MTSLPLSSSISSFSTEALPTFWYTSVGFNVSSLIKFWELWRRYFWFSLIWLTTLQWKPAPWSLVSCFHSFKSMNTSLTEGSFPKSISTLHPDNFLLLNSHAYRIIDELESEFHLTSKMLALFLDLSIFSLTHFYL